MLPIRSQLGRDGNWHAARAPEPPPERAIGGGPIDPSCLSSAVPEGELASASSSPPGANDAANTASAAPSDVATTEINASGAPIGVPGASDTTLETVHVESASSLHRVRGGGPADVDAYSLTYLHPRPRPRIARFMLGAGGGTGMYTGETDARDLGASWYAGLGVEVARVLTIEGRYQGAHNVVPVGLDPSGSYGVLANGVTGLVRLAIPTPYVSPYVQSGLGYLWFSTTGTPQGQGTVVPSGLTNLPVGGGIEFRFTRGVALDVEYNYQFLLDSRWTFDHASHPWGDLWNAMGAMRFYL